MANKAPVRSELDLLKDLATIHQYRMQDDRMSWREIAKELSRANDYTISAQAIRMQYNRFKAKALEAIAEDIRENMMLEIQELKAELWESWEQSLKGRVVSSVTTVKIEVVNGKKTHTPKDIKEKRVYGDVQFLNAYLKACDQEAKLVGLYTEDESGDGAEVAEWVEIVYPTKEEAQQIKAAYEAKQNPNE